MLRSQFVSICRYSKAIALRQVSITESSTELNKSISSQNQSVPAFSKMLLPIQDAWLTFSNSRIFPIPINILIRLRGWLNGFLSFFPRLFQFFPSLTAWLGFATVESNRFLAPSEAITLGDIDYMNTPKKIERTFAKTKSNPEGGSKVRFVSALQKTVILDDPTAIDVSKSQSKSAIALINSNRRILDPNLVSFRNMALVITAST